MVRPEGAHRSGNLSERKTAGIARFLDVEKGAKENDQAGILGLGRVVPVTEPGRGLCAWVTPTLCCLDSWIDECLEERVRVSLGHVHDE